LSTGDGPTNARNYPVLKNQNSKGRGGKTRGGTGEAGFFIGEWEASSFGKKKEPQRDQKPITSEGEPDF